MLAGIIGLSEKQSKGISKVNAANAANGSLNAKGSILNKCTNKLNNLKINEHEY